MKFIAFGEKGAEAWRAVNAAHPLRVRMSEVTGRIYFMQPPTISQEFVIALYMEKRQTTVPRNGGRPKNFSTDPLQKGLLYVA
jgi:hypothetical protein